MDDFELILPNHEDIMVLGYVPPHLRAHTLKGFTPIVVQADFGEMLFEKFRGDGFEAWKSSYNIIKPISIKGIVNHPILECTIMYENSFFYRLERCNNFYDS
jgi:hypothetical protein